MVSLYMELQGSRTNLSLLVDVHCASKQSATKEKHLQNKHINMTRILYITINRFNNGAVSFKTYLHFAILPDSRFLYYKSMFWIVSLTIKTNFSFENFSNRFLDPSP